MTDDAYDPRFVEAWSVDPITGELVRVRVRIGTLDQGRKHRNRMIAESTFAGVRRRRY